MSIIIRLQNLAWAANSVDIRRYFSGLSIPEGGVHIVGGEKGDAFIAFSTDEDARLAMEKDGGKIKEMKIKLLLSSRTEMLRVIEQARQQNLVVQPADSDRRKGAGGNRVDRSPSPRARRSSPARDKRRSSKRERSRSRSRSPGRRSRDVDRRNSNDRFRRDDRRPDDGSQRYNNRDERQKRDTRDHERKNENSTYDQRTQKNYPYSSETKNLDSLQRSDRVFDARNSVQTDPYQEKRENTPLIPQPMGFQRGGIVPTQVNQEKEIFDKRPPHLDAIQEKPRRRSRFDPEFPSPADDPFFSDLAPNNGPRKSTRDQNLDNPTIASTAAYKTTSRHDPPVPFQMREDTNNRPWPRPIENGDWEEKRPGLLDHPVLPLPKNRDFVQVVPMDIDDGHNSPERALEKEQAFRLPHTNPIPLNRDRLQHTGLPPFARNDNQHPNALLRNNQESIIEPRKLPGKHTEGPSFMVQVKGLRNNASESDVLQLFRGIPLPPENVSLEVGTEGLIAYVQFLNGRDFEEGISRNMQFIGQNRVEVSSCSSFNSMNTNKRNIPVRTKDLCVQLRGVPLACKEDNIAHFFNGLGILDIFVEREADGRSTGIGYVEFAKIVDFHASLSMNGKMLGHHSITIVEVSKEMIEIAKSESLKKQEQFKFEQMAPAMRIPPQSQRPVQQVGGVPMCVVMRGLPENVMNRDIADFFSEINVIPRAIHIMLKNKMPSGDAFAELCHPRDVDLALQQNGKFLLGVRVSVTPITFHEMSEIMGRPLPDSHEQSLVPPQHMQPHVPEHIPHIPEHVQPHIPEHVQPHIPEHMQPHIPEHVQLHAPEHMQPHPPPHMQPRAPAPALLKTPGEDDRPRRPHIGPGEHEIESQPPRGRTLLERFEPPRGPRPPFPRMRGAPFRGPRPSMRPYGTDGPPRGSRFSSRNPGHHNSDHGPRDFGPYRFSPRNPRPSTSESGPKDFGTPGCVVSINNLHFRAGLEELLEFFDGYSIGKDQVVRKYNENGQTTGEARIAFNNPGDAQQAVGELNHKPIMGRPLSLSVV